MSSLLTNAGLANITAAWHAYASRSKYLQWGTGDGQIATDNALDDTTGTTEARVDGTTSVQTGSVANDTYRVTGTITAAGARAITEVATFDGAGSGSPPTGDNMGIYGDFSVINLGAADSITFTLNVRFA
jgi:hypothetical protein